MDNYNWIRSEQINQPVAEPLTLEQVKKHLRIELDDTYHDDYLTSLIPVAREEAELITKRRFEDQLIDVYFQRPANLKLYGCGVVQDVKIYMRDKKTRDWVEVNPDKYEFIKSTPARIHFFNVDPFYFLEYLENVKVEASCGQSTPETVKQWMLLRIGTLFENREADSQRAIEPQSFAAQLLRLHMIMDF